MSSNLFPPRQQTKLFEDDDKFLDLFWDKVDQAKDYVMVTTYDIDHLLTAGITMKKCAAAARRGVKVYIIVDGLNFRARMDLVRECKEAGCLVVVNNPVSGMWRHYLKFRPWDFYTRNHEKVMLVDDHTFCGSLNISAPYTNMKYGIGAFRDLNLFLGYHECQK
jgi:phosphatidylserine/phosphatidylglycerophosphate/cardiolipin synthase-like enzyme